MTQLRLCYFGFILYNYITKRMVRKIAYVSIAKTSEKANMTKYVTISPK